MRNSIKAKTTSLVVLLISVFLLSAFAGVHFVGKVSAAGYTETYGILDGAAFGVRFPDSWNGGLVVGCRGYNPVEPRANGTFFTGSSQAFLDIGYAFAASTYGSGGFCIQKGMNSTYQLTKFLVNTYHVTGKVFLYGLSMGGAVALLLGEKYPTLYSGVIDGYGTKDLKNQYETKARWANLSDTALTAELTALTIPVPPSGYANLTVFRTFMANNVAEFENETGGTPTTKPKAYEDDSPTYHANISIPVITIHGTSDAIVPYYESIMYQTAVANAGRSSLYRLYTVVGAEHGASSINQQARFTRFPEIVSWSDMLESSFSIMQISDTQHLAWLSPTLYNDTTSWIVNNSAYYNLQMVVHTGDFIDQPGYNQSQWANEWANANASMSKLLNAGIPYCWDAGNHDQTPFFNSNGTMMGSSYLAFNATYMRSKPYWVDDIYDSKNTAVKFSYNNYPFLIINLENFANASAIGWMKGLLDKNTGVNTIVATHAYLNETGGYIQSIGTLPVTWSDDLKATLDNYSNVFLVLSGHVAGWNMTRAGNRQEILFDRQGPSNSTGAASVRIYTFNLTSKTVNASTYCIDTQTWLTDAYNQFNFNASLRAFTFGNTNVGTYQDQNDAHAKSASYFTCNYTGTITDIFAYVAREDAVGDGAAAIYADNEGSPGALIAATDEATVNTTFSWVDFPLLSPVNVTAGTGYWLAISSNNALNLKVVIGLGVRIHNGISSWFSDPFGPVWCTHTAGAMSIYASGTSNTQP
jgi:pimeloyl-ACP methyl ester carboxylesterase